MSFTPMMTAEDESTFLLQRMLYTAHPAALNPIPWPNGKGPTKPAKIPVNLPTADVLVITYTVAEGQALADVLTPGHESTEWERYVTNWRYFEQHLTGRSPARYAKCLGQWAMTEIDGKSVALFKSDLHLSTDDGTLPFVRLVQQLVEHVKPELLITTGTAGGIGSKTGLGDVTVTNGAKFNCAREFKTAPFAQQTFTGPAWKPGDWIAQLTPLLAANSSRLAPINTNPLKVNCVLDKPGVETMDYFGFADDEDSYGVVKNDPDAGTEEMDDACVPLALETTTMQPNWLSIRNASDPQVPRMADLPTEVKWAAAIYEKYGYWTSVASAITTWAVIADL